jgi:hypothetical protein
MSAALATEWLQTKSKKASGVAVKLLAIVARARVERFTARAAFR